MSLFGMIKKGFTTVAGYKKAITFIWMINFIVAFFIANPYLAAVAKFFKNSAVSDMFMNGNFMLIAGEFDVFRPAAKQMFFSSIALGLVLYFFLSIAINGGFIGLLVRERGNKIASLLRSGFGNYKHLLAIAGINFLISVLLILLAGGLFAALKAILHLYREPETVITIGVILVFTLILWMLKDLFIDYLRIKLFRNLGSGKYVYIKDTLEFIKNNFIKLFVYYIVMLIVLLLGLYIISFVKDLFSGINVFSILLHFIFIQLLIVFRIYWRTSFWAGEVSLLEGPMGGKIFEKDLWPEDMEL